MAGRSIAPPGKYEMKSESEQKMEKGKYERKNDKSEQTDEE